MRTYTHSFGAMLLRWPEGYEISGSPPASYAFASRSPPALRVVDGRKR